MLSRERKGPRFELFLSAPLWLLVVIAVLVTTLNLVYLIFKLGVL